MSWKLVSANELQSLVKREPGNAQVEIVPAPDGHWAVTAKVAGFRYILACADSDRIRTYPTLLGGVRRALRSFATRSGIWICPDVVIEGCTVTPKPVA